MSSIVQRSKSIHNYQRPERVLVLSSWIKITSRFSCASPRQYYHQNLNGVDEVVWINRILERSIERHPFDQGRHDQIKLNFEFYPDNLWEDQYKEKKWFFRILSKWKWSCWHWSTSAAKRLFKSFLKATNPSTPLAYFSRRSMRISFGSDSNLDTDMSRGRSNMYQLVKRIY